MEFATYILILTLVTEGSRPNVNYVVEGLTFKQCRSAETEFLMTEIPQHLKDLGITTSQAACRVDPNTKVEPINQ